MKYLGKEPFSSRPASDAYREGWSTAFRSGKARLADMAEAAGMKVIRKEDCEGPYQGAALTGITVDEMKPKKGKLRPCRHLARSPGTPYAECPHCSAASRGKRGKR